MREKKSLTGFKDQSLYIYLCLCVYFFFFFALSFESVNLMVCHIYCMCIVHTCVCVCGLESGPREIHDATDDRMHVTILQIYLSNVLLMDKREQKLFHLILVELSGASNVFLYVYIKIIKLCGQIYLVMVHDYVAGME